MLELLTGTVGQIVVDQNSLDYGKLFARNGIGFVKGFAAGFISSSVLLLYSSDENIIKNSFIGGTAVTAAYDLLDYFLNPAMNVLEDDFGTFAGAFAGTYVTQKFKSRFEKGLEEEM